jgi:hypothetical protein
VFDKKNGIDMIMIFVLGAMMFALGTCFGTMRMGDVCEGSADDCSAELVVCQDELEIQQDLYSNNCTCRENKKTYDALERCRMLLSEQ